MKAEKMINKAKVTLLLKSPFFASFALSIKYISDTNIETACTNGRWIKYNPSFIESLTHDEVVGLLAHEILHPLNLHHTRRANRDHKKWNEAADYAINPILIDAKFKLPKGALNDPRYKNLSAEAIYNLLPENKTNKADPGGCGGVEDGPKDENEKKQEEARIKQQIANARLLATRQQGDFPDSLQRFIDEILRPKISWQEALAVFLMETVKNDYSWSAPSPRYLHMGLYLPSLKNEEPGTVVLIIDTSGSITPPIVNQFASEAQEIVNTFGVSITVIYVDTDVRGVEVFEADEPIKLNPIGGGGTDFRPGFNYIEQKGIEPKAVVYLTDGYCYKFPEAPDYPVLWAQFDSPTYDFTPPFGEVIRVEDED